MGLMLVLHPYVAGYRPRDQAPCWEALHRVSEATGAVLLHVRCDHPMAYADGLQRAVEASYVVVTCEQDIVPTPEQVHELVHCPWDYCAMDYELECGKLWSAGADHACLGLAKMTHSAWDHVKAKPRVPRVYWSDLAYEVSMRLGLWHLHAGPVEHRHRKL